MGEKRRRQGGTWNRSVSRRSVLKAGAAAGPSLSGVGPLVREDLRAGAGSD
jgi:hypothetical protein